jgi:hypothetical protein
MVEISTIVRRGRASVLPSIHIGCNQKHLEIEPGAVHANVSVVCCFRVVLWLPPMLSQHCRNVFGNVGSNMIPTLCCTLEPMAEAVLREDV